MSDISQIHLPDGNTYNLKDTEGRKEENLQWGGTNQVGQVSPIGMALSNEHSVNRLAFINGDALTFEYSSDGGSTWTNYGYSSAEKSWFCTSIFSVPIGRPNGTTNCTTSCRTRITLTAQNGTTAYVYTDPRKMLINVSSANGMQVLVEYRTGTNYLNDGAWLTFGTYTLSGWSGWNDIPLILGTLGGGTTQYDNYWQLRLTFIITNITSSSEYANYSDVIGLRIYGANGWAITSNMGSTGHLYSYDASQNATFPANVYATNFIGNLIGGASTADKAYYLNGFSPSWSQAWGNQTGTFIHGEDDATGGSLAFRRDNPASGQMSMIIDGTVYIKEGGQNVGDAIKSISRSGTTFTYTTLWGNTGTFTQQDNNTTYTISRDGIDLKLTPSSGSAQNLSIFPPISKRDFVDGTLITTDIDYSETAGDSFLLIIYADGYGAGRYLTIANGYIYNDTIINYGVTNHDTRISSLIAQNVNGKLCFWFNRLAYWQSFGCLCYSSNNGDYATNHIVSITDSADPNGTKRVDLCVNQRDLAFTNEIPTNNNQLTNGAGYITSSGSCAYATSAGSASPTSGSTYYIQNCTNSSRSTATSGSWIAMLNSSETGNPTLPTSSQWWTVLSADCWNSSPWNWMSQLAIATQDTNGVWWRRNDSADASIDSSIWHRLAEGDSDGNAKVANKLGSSNVGSATNPIYLNSGTATACTYSLNKTVPSDAVFTDTKVTQTAVSNTDTEFYSILLSNTSNSTSTETAGVKKTRYGKICYVPNTNKIVNVSGISITNNSNNSNRIALDTWMDGGYISVFDTNFSQTITLKGANGDIETTGTVTANSVTCNSMSVQDISTQYTFHKTSGPWTVQEIRAVRSGNVVTMQLVIKGGSAVSAGSNGIAGTLSGGPLPAKINDGTQDIITSGVCYYGNSALVGTLTSSGSFVLRLLINNQSLGSSTTSMCFTFVCD